MDAKFSSYFIHFDIWWMFCINNIEREKRELYRFQLTINKLDSISWKGRRSYIFYQKLFSFNVICPLVLNQWLGAILCMQFKRKKKMKWWSVLNINAMGAFWWLWNGKKYDSTNFFNQIPFYYRFFLLNLCL